ncbi:hypothetical protein Amet_0264 [Alkaliphilus metalliredigens QYMF]|uniref:Ethanolamine utilization protein n=1 Tax=Alkaliphilus metalliredigens (strain QYMF) TaxID=293826 RepID=A6TJX9_ALKMQ|nr:hypothetical protein [Alkaliphilus metalliredigens]ABR46497.1 hypothetical protein Amet_0264 [Alkaliphilus metalliredigens QYMF]
MEIEVLVQKITEEVMKQLKGRQKNEKPQFSKKALILSDKNPINKQEIRQLETMGVECVSLGECPEDEIRNMDYIILLTLPLSSLSYIARGVEGDEISKGAIGGLLYGKEIFVLCEGIEHRKFEQTSQHHFYQMYMDYEKKLQGFGVKIGTLKKILSLLNQKPQQEQSSTEAIKQAEEIRKTEESVKTEQVDEKESPLISNKLITENTLKEMGCREKSRISITAKAIVTPMANDYIRMMKIQVIRV